MLNTSRIVIAIPGGWTNQQALINLGAQVNLISQPLVKKSERNPSKDIHVFVAGWKGHKFITYGVHELTLCMTNSNGCERETTEQFIAVNINSCELLLGLPWVWRCNLTIEWRHNTWQHETKLRAKETPLSAFADAVRSRELAFIAFVYADPTKSRASPQILTVRMHKIPDAYQEFKDGFSNTFSQAVPKHSPWDHVINTQDAKVPYGPIYPLSERQLQVL